MNYPQFEELEKLICEYEEDAKSFNSQKLIMRNYPKVLIMSSASLFETQIKQYCQSFIDNPIFPISTHFTQINVYISAQKPTVDAMFAKFKTVNRKTQIEQYDASDFYKLFGGTTFKSAVESYFNNEIASQKQLISNRISALLPLCGQQERYDFDYAKYSDLKDELERCSFNDAELSFLILKRKRNQVAHNYINPLTDTFDDLVKFYNKAIIYVIALEKGIQSLTLQTN